MSSEDFNTEAILLKSAEYGEAHRIITFFTKEMGKIKAFAPHAKKSKKRFSTSLDLFSYVDAVFTLRRGDSLPALKTASTAISFRNIRKNIMHITMAGIMAEVYCEMTPEESPSERLFSLLSSFLKDLDDGVISREIMPLYLLKFLRLSGFSPNFDCCTSCQNKLDKTKVFFASERGGVVCARCSGKGDRRNVELSGESLNVLRREKDMAQNLVKRLVMSAKTAVQIESVLRGFVEFNIGKGLKSYKFLEELDGVKGRIR